MRRTFESEEDLMGLMGKVLGLQHPHEKVVEIFSRQDHRGRLLDAGAGPGVLSKRLKEAGFDVVATDINPFLFSVPEIRCEKADLNQNLPFPDESFDYILCSNTIEHLEDPYQFVRECYRILKERGKLLITTPNILNLKSRMANLFVGFNLFKGRPSNEVDSYQGGDHIHLATYYELRINLHRNGFRILEATTHRYSPTAMLLSPLYPLIFIATHRAFQREKNPKQRERNREILDHVLSPDLIFGKKLFLLAEKDPLYLPTQKTKGSALG
ncbi:MAG: class I SAM-dependent methyltransferase [Thermodesulfobacteriota bacterium]